MYAQATTTVTVYRGTSTDAYGDTVDTGTAVATGVPVSILERRRIASTPADGRVQQLTWLVGRAGADADIEPGDQLEDEVSGDYYRVDDVDQVASPVTTTDLRLELRRID